MTNIHINQDAMAEMISRDQTEPLMMLNLLRYRDVAETGFGVDGLSGEEAYRVYGEKFAKLNPRFGGEPVWMGAALASLIGEEQWDVVIVVRYPTRGHFINMVNDPDYQAIAPIRAAALEDSRLIECDQLLPRA